jgi:serine/threonine protein kinase
MDDRCLEIHFQVDGPAEDVVGGGVENLEPFFIPIVDLQRMKAHTVMCMTCFRWHGRPFGPPLLQRRGPIRNVPYVQQQQQQQQRRRRQTSKHSDGIVGTDGYQAPELLAGTRYTSKIDVYSLAVTPFPIWQGMRGLADWKHEPKPCVMK